MINYNNRKFKPISNSENGEVSNELIFHYQQNENIIHCNYSGGTIIKGHLLGTVNPNGVIQMAYHQINEKGELKTGICTSSPITLKDGRIQLQEKWQWTSGDKSHGQSTLIEVIG